MRVTRAVELLTCLQTLETLLNRDRGLAQISLSLHPEIWTRVRRHRREGFESTLNKGCGACVYFIRALLFADG